MNKTVKSYNEFAQELAHKFDAIGARSKDIELVFSYVKKENPRVLELGCGNGRDAQEILKRTKNYLGVDGSKELVNIAKKKLPKAQFDVCLFDKLKFPDCSFDIIIDFASLMHLNKIKLTKILKEISHWLDDSGVLSLSIKEGKYSQFLSRGFGERIQYSYLPDDVLLMAKDNYVMLNLERMNKNDKNWFTIILQKK